MAKPDDRRYSGAVYWERRLPHWVPERASVFVTWRLAGPPPYKPAVLIKDPGRRFAHEDREMDRAPTGPKWLRDPAVAEMCTEALHHGAGTRYELHAWVIMPNHVHLILTPKADLAQTVRWLKIATAKRTNDLLGRTGQPFWHREYFDHWIRSEQEFNRVVRCVEHVAAGLVQSPEHWQWSSAYVPPVVGLRHR